MIAGIARARQRGRVVYSAAQSARGRGAPVFGMLELWPVSEAGGSPDVTSAPLQPAEFSRLTPPPPQRVTE